MSLRILAVDDAPEILRVLERVLTRAGHQVFLAATGNEALAFARAVPLDAAIVDYEMPGPNGIQVLEVLRKVRPQAVTILASGTLDVPAVTDAVNRGDVSRVLLKPYDGQELLQALTGAFEARKQLGESFLQATRAAQSKLGEGLAACFRDKLLALATQPIVAADGGEVVAHEALLRSAHRELKGPMDVLAAAECTGQLPQLCRVVFDLARQTLDRLPDTRLFLNLHPQDLADPDVLRALIEPLRAQASRITCEITERSNVAEIHAWRASIALLRDAGFGIAVDDLGAGYSSLATLAQVKPEYMKVDMSIVRGIDKDTYKQSLLELLSGFARATNAVVVAEGIETEAEATTAAACGAHWLQGYYFGKPTVNG